MEMIVELNHIHKQFENYLVLEDLSLEIEKNSFTVLYGTSGCGKTLIVVTHDEELIDMGDVKVELKPVL